ncbi:RNA polymerase subunit sigma [Heyndrickxia shackletonii]|uniref:RNA polymerase subunit sigma n=1 Tax=Heyndrickxia shackletonii TaxID=157838 RepID=A0A0Q3WTU4_9BACI|nr:sigma-70 family RNA polymerase sigma factor [Heyndrickxia shackletonii]KQL51450.1 RNA polymerase subunit sigma [Heyndrickxia shackletonii]MBB2480023.1 sigma-70 family RNA polymerase sigma factor [Bacillus sp. APMAM]NEZ00796.1 sigma-70 family RNA polymerase sigma factor [Heyndrickxia shackletonii]RTZ56559.1 sigma-70 family RNA polymerase sigma factor [Bacillus sp. SAJ1]
MDAALIEKAKTGNEHAFRLLVEKYRMHVFHTVFAILRNQQDAEDAAQEVFLKIYASLPQYENQGFKTWITRISVNHAIDMKRKKTRRQEEAVIEFQPEFHHAGKAETAEVIVLKKEQKIFFEKRLGEIPDNYRDVIEGFYIKEKSYHELAEEQQVQVKTIETKLYRARQWMKKHWKEDDFR